MEPTLLTAASDDEEESIVGTAHHLKVFRFNESQPFNGQLNREFKFGGKHKPAREASQESLKPMLLSEINPTVSTSPIPSDEDSVMKSIMAKAVDLMAELSNQEYLIHLTTVFLVWWNSLHPRTSPQCQC
jgi:hypothetical protein